MFKNFLTIACRNIFRHKIFSFVNIFGLALGIASSLMLLQYVSYELSYDKFHSNAPDIYRVIHSAYKNSSVEFVEALNYHGVAPAIRESFPEVINAVRLHRADGMVSYHGAEGKFVSHHEQSSLYADSSFFSIFSFPLVAGDPHKVLSKSSSVLVSESTAKKYFGDESPMGKTISLTTEWAGGDYIVEGVFKDVPRNSHVKFDFLFAIGNLLQNDQFKYGGWYWTNFYTYLLLKPGTDPEQLETKLSSIIDTHLGKELKKLNREEVLSLQPLLSIHLNSNIGGELEGNGSQAMVSFLVIIAFAIICIAWLNYINLSTAKATERAREVGIRKVMGSPKSLLIKQFLLESSVIALIALLLASALIIVFIPYFGLLTGKDVTFNIQGQLPFWLMALGVVVTGTFFSALYPAFVISSFSPLITLKGKLLKGSNGALLRRGLVVTQFGVAMILIIFTITVYRQLQFMREQDLGMSISQKLIVRAPRIIQGGSYLNAMDLFKNKIKVGSKIISVAASSEVPGKEIFWGNHIRLENEPEESQKPTNLMAVDEGFIPTYEMTLLAGRNFSKEMISDFGNTVILNEKAVRLLNIKDPETAIGQEVVIAGGGPVKIIGVIKDFHQRSLRHQTVQLALQYIPWHNDYVTLSVAGGDIREAVDDVARVYKEVFPENAFEYFFMDEQFNAQYQSEEQSSKIFALFAVMAVGVALMGLFGLASFLTIQRSKEIAIRKIVGASVTKIMLLLSKEFISLVILAFIFAAPLSWLLMNQWLSDFSYRVNLALWTFGVAGVGTVIIAFLTVGFLSIRAASRNPVDAIRTE